MALYESDLTKFIRQFLAEHPEELEVQKQGRGLWWDKAPIARKPGTHGAHPPKAGGNEHTFRALDEK